MKVEITDKQLEKLQKHIQNLIDGELDNLREESQDWGLGEMDELEELESVKRIEIDRIVPYKRKWSSLGMYLFLIRVLTIQFTLLKAAFGSRDNLILENLALRQ